MRARESVSMCFSVSCCDCLTSHTAATWPRSTLRSDTRSPLHNVCSSWQIICLWAHADQRQNRRTHSVIYAEVAAGLWRVSRHSPANLPEQHTLHGGCTRIVLRQREEEHPKALAIRMLSLKKQSYLTVPVFLSSALMLLQFQFH